MLFVFYCNATEETGLGHLSRCLQIALAIKNQQVDSEIVFHGVYSDFAKQLLQMNQLTWQMNIDEGNIANACVILDDYQLTQLDLDHFVNTARFVVKIDDFDELDTRQLDLVINFRLSFDNHPYQAKHCALGIKYFPFKSSLVPIRAYNLENPRSKITNIFIFIGGNDHNRAGEKLVSLIEQHLINKEIFWITGQEQKNAINCQRNKLTVLPLTSKIEHYYQQADFFISGGGLSKYEVSFCGIPNASISQNQGQSEDSQIFAEYGLSYDLGLTNELDNNPQNVTNKLIDYCQKNTHNHFYQQSARYFDSNSCNALALKIIQVAQ
ncbi:hypothetical protein [Colwellia sp. MEBiC06753]